MIDNDGGPKRAAQPRLRTALRLHPGGESRPALDRLTALARRLLGVESSIVSLVTEVVSTVGAAGLPAQLSADTAISESLCARTAEQGRPLVINDTFADPATAALPAVVAGMAGSFLGAPVRADDRSVVGALCVFDPAPRLWTQDEVDTVQALAESAAAELELAALARDFEATRARWDLAVESSGMGSFDWDLRTGQLSWDAPLIALFGYDDDDVFAETIEAFNARVHPDDLPTVTATLRQAVDTAGDFEAEYRVVLPDGVIRHVQARGRAIGRGAVADRVLGAAWDVSVTRGAEDRATRLVQAMPVGYLRVDADGTVLAGNQLAEQLLRARRSELLHQVLWHTIPESAADRLRDLCARVLASGDLDSGELHFAEPIDAWFEVRAVPDTDGVSLFFTDVTTRRDTQDAADAAAVHNREIATTLQQAMLTQLPERDHLELRARYVPAAVADQVGGDWYDAVVQPDGATTVVVGDVSGHDIDAAATMGQLRSMMRAFLWQANDNPATVTTALDHAIGDLYPGALATAVTARIEQDDAHKNAGTHLLRWTNAGHPPPLVVDTDGAVRLLDAPPQLMLGVRADTARRDHTVDCSPTRRSCSTPTVSSNDARSTSTPVFSVSSKVCTPTTSFPSTP